MSPRACPSRQRGATLLVVLLLLTVLLLGALSMARSSATGTLIAGNIAFRDTARQASEAGVAEAFAQLSARGDDDHDAAGWYFATKQTDGAGGLPEGIDWNDAPELEVGAYTVRYVVERLCQGPAPVADVARQCVIKRVPQVSSARIGVEELEAPAAKQYRVTVSAVGPKATQVFVQSMVAR